MKLTRILSTLSENRIRATVDAVLDLADMGSDELMKDLAADPERARWVVSADSYTPVIPNGHEHLSMVGENPVVIGDAARLRVLVVATELTAMTD